jgi:hypothetical protein
MKNNLAELRLEPRQENHGETSVIVGPLGIVCEFESRVWDDQAKLTGEAKNDREYVALFVAAPKLLSAAEKVIASWEKGDLAAAVRTLAAAVEEAKPKSGACVEDRINKRMAHLADSISAQVPATRPVTKATKKHTGMGPGR